MIIHQSTEDYFLNLISSSDAVFHYTKKSTALEKILLNDQYILSSLSNTNDPYEYKNKMIGASGWSWDEKIKSNLPKLSKALDQLLAKNTSFISCCCNEFNLDRLLHHGFLKSRMWSQYGENHEGVCLVFSRKSLFELIQKQYKSDKYLLYEGDVDYKEYLNADAGHDSVSVNHDTFDNKTPFDTAIEHINKFQRELLFRKQLDYKDEKEYRIVAIYKKKSTNFLKVPEFEVSKCLLGIILGDRFPKVYIPSITKLANKLNIKYRQLHWEGGEYYLPSGN